MGVVVLIILVLLALWVLSALLHVTFAVMLPLLVWMLSGMFAGRIIRGRGYGPVGDIVLGLFGGILGNWLSGLVGLNIGIITAVIFGTLGAVILVYLIRLVGNSQFAA
ncbi:MAG: hypothetical protein K8I60_02605 [Anaerolineae bacterium]|nr:hypothetical protein [Anaerolineae bacterium]